MRVGVVVPELTESSGGSFTLVGEILGALPQGTGRHTFELLHYGERSALLPAGSNTVQLSDVPFRLQGTLDRALAGRHLDVVWFLTPDTEQVELPFIATVWDLEHRTQPFFPEVSVAGWKWEEREYFYRSTLPRAAFVLTGSEEGRRQVHQFYRVPLERIAVVPFPAPGFPAAPGEPSGSPLAELDIPEPFVFYPAQLWPHKNHVALLLALALLAEEEGLRPGAVFTGADKGNLAHLRRTIAELGLDAQVRILGLVDRRTVAALYRAALALVFPSFFGPDNLPPLEAFALGCPVLAAEVPGAREQLGDAALLFDPKDERELARAMKRLLSEPNLRAELVRKGGARAHVRTPAAYVASVIALLDAFEPIRRTWARGGRFEHL